ncbi:MAG: alpha/beta fold hydrolase, partial [Rhodocyclaceae bacterium]|nr:alpha/beta fold hydrolase [Rhodocyclaceae bacterium]
MNLAPAYANPETLNADRISRYHSLLLLPGQRDAMPDRMAQTILTDPVPKPQKINAPTLLLWGEQDALIPIANAQDYLRALPTAKLVTLLGVGHVPQDEAPAMSLAPLVALLAN